MARLEAMQSTPTPVDTFSPIFINIAPEIRNRIYGSVVDSFDIETQTDLLQTTPPSKALLFTCREPYDECKYMYRAAYRRFWAESNLALRIPPEVAARRKALKYFKPSKIKTWLTRAAHAGVRRR